MRLLRILALIALCLAFTPTSALAVTGYDSSYNSESAFVMIDPGQTQSFQVFFVNTGTTTWAKGSDTEVDLAACRADKVTCNAQDPTDSTWNSGWLSTSRYATTTQASVAPGSVATFAYNIKAPTDATGTHRFNGDLVVASSGARVHPEGYYQDATMKAVGSVTGPTPTPLNFTISPWAYACGTTTSGNPVTATDTLTGSCADDTPGTATASFTSGALSLSKDAATTDNLSSGATVGGLSHLTTAEFDVAGTCGGGAPRLNVVTADGHTHFYGCNTNNVGTHVSINFQTSLDGSGNGGILPTDTVTAIDFVFDETGSASITNIKFNGLR